MNNSHRLDSQISEHSFKDKKLSKMPSSFFKSFTSSKKGIKDEFQFFNRSQECTLHTVLYMLVNFEKVEEESKKKGFSILGKTKPIVDMESYTDLSMLRPELIYFFSVISVRDLHDFYIDFYASFDANKNFTLEKKELLNMFQIVLNLLGQKKFKVFSDLTLIDQESFEGELTPKVIDDIAENFITPDDPNKVDYLLLFPYILSFYLEYTYQEIKNKQKRLDIIKGTEYIRGKEVEIKNITSLISILREMGVDYLKEKKTYKLSYRDVENILLKFKNIQKWMNFEVIQQILQSLSKVMNVDSKTQEESKKLKVEKIIDFITLKLCIHQQCLKIKQTQKDSRQSIFLEVLVMWNAAQFGHLANKKFFDLKFQKYIQSKYLQQDLFSRVELQKCLEHFFKKHFQLMPKQQIYDIIQCHKLFNAKNVVKNYKIEKDELLQSLHSMICIENFNKLKRYIKIKFEGIEKKTTTQSHYQNYGKNLDQDSAQGGSQSQRQLVDQEQQFQTQKKEQKKESKQVVDDNSEESEDESNNKGATQKFKKAVRAIQSGNAFQQEGIGSKDILKACLIMDSFLKRQTQRVKNYQKETQSLNVSFQQENKVSEIQNQNDQEQLTILEQAAQLNKQKKKNEVKKEGKEWENIPKPKEPEPIISNTQIIQKVDLITEAKSKKTIDRSKVADELQLVLGKSSTDFGPGDFKKALRLQTSSEVVQSTRPFIKQQTDNQDNLVIINEGALEHMIKSNVKQQKSRKSTRDDCQCKIF